MGTGETVRGRGAPDQSDMADFLLRYLPTTRKTGLWKAAAFKDLSDPSKYFDNASRKGA
jgi:hypothetical protein